MSDLKAFTSTSQTGSNACSSVHICSHICVGAPDAAYSCLCPNGMNLTTAGRCTICKPGETDCVILKSNIVVGGRTAPTVTEGNLSQKTYMHFHQFQMNFRSNYLIGVICRCMFKST